MQTNPPHTIVTAQTPVSPVPESGVWLPAATYWYLSVVLAALGFSLGFYFMRAPTAPRFGRRDPLRAVALQDGRSYARIAVEGYQYDPNARSTVAYFPVFPLLGRYLMVLTGLRAEAALLIVSNVALLGALGILGGYVRARYRGEAPEIVNYAVLSAALFPTGCFFHLAYSESTCLLLTVVAMFAMHRRQPLWIIALIVGLAVAARPVGVALLAPFAIHIARRSRAPLERTAEPEEARDARVADTEGLATSRVTPCRHWLPGLWRFVVYLPIASWGLAGFAAFQYNAFGDPFAAFKAHDQWRVRPRVSLGLKSAALLSLEPIRAVYGADSPIYWAKKDEHGLPWFSLQFANPIFFVVAIVLLATGAWRGWLSTEETSLGMLMLLIPYLTRAYEMGMGSMGRFVAVVFPIYLVLGRILAAMPAPLRASIFGLSAFYLAICTALYAAGYAFF